MINIEKVRIEAKLKLWNTPGFSQFLDDLIGELPSGSEVLNSVERLKREYIKTLKDIEEKGSRFKQTKLDI